MNKIFRTFGNTILVWVIFSAINYKWPANGVLASWNFFVISPDSFWKIFSVFALLFITASYGYIIGVMEEKKIEKYKIGATKFVNYEDLEKLRNKINKDKED